MAIPNISPPWSTRHHLDASIGGLGGCPSPRAPRQRLHRGLVHCLVRDGIETGIDLDR